MRILDFHNHIGVGEDERVNQSLEQLLDDMQSFGVERAVAFPFFEKDRGLDYRVPNDRVLLAAERDARLIPFARLDPSNAELASAEAHRAVARGARGFKIHTQSDKFTFQQLGRTLAEVHQFRLPIVVHYWDNLKRDWLEMFRRYPETPFVIAHAGGMRHSPLAAKMAEVLPNVFIDTSAIMFLFFAFALSTTPLEKILFGSDSPFSNQYLEVKKVALLTSARQQQAIFWDNGARLLGL